jgi:branched-chain amino acid transport system ATP-binding protein
MLRITDLHAFYGESHILHGIDLRVPRASWSRCWAATAPGRSTTLKR